MFFDVVHLIKNVRNNLLNRKRFTFPSFEFLDFYDDIKIPEGYISWKIFYEIYEKDSLLQANLRKAYDLTYQAIHPGNNKQDVPLALSIFDESTSAALLSFFPEKSDAAEFLRCFNKVFLICNSKQRFNTANRLGDAVVRDDKKTIFF